LIDSTAREGQPHQLVCRVVGIPAPLISWYKNGVCVDHSRDYIITYDDGLCTLSFSQVFVEDGAMFECRAANEAGDADTAATLIVERKFKKKLYTQYEIDEIIMNKFH
jgi:titin